MGILWAHRHYKLYKEEEPWYCTKGKIVITPLPPLPEEMFRRPAFRAHSQQYNNHSAIMAMGVAGVVRKPAPSCV